MSVESLKRVLTKIRAEARDMRKQKYSNRIAPKPKEPAAATKAPDATEKIRELLSKG